jgi:proteic killer suppression protein
MLWLMIRSFADREARLIFEGGRSRSYAGLERVIGRKLLALHAARLLSDLTIPPGNRLEALKGDRRGQHSIRVNDQYRICFRWEEPDAHGVQIVDYH